MLYPMVDLHSDHYTKPFEKPICGVPNFPDQLVEDFITSKLDASSITEADPPVRLDLALATVQNGRFLEFLGDEAELFPLERIKNKELSSQPVGKSILPPFYILHGENDTAVPLEGTLKLLEHMREVGHDAKMHVVIRPGDHGFDASTTIQEDWMKAGLDFIAQEWIVVNKSRI